MSKSKQILEVLFGSNLKIKILKYLFRNAPASFNVQEISNHVQDEPAVVKKEIDRLIDIGLIKIKR